MTALKTWKNGLKKFEFLYSFKLALVLWFGLSLVASLKHGTSIYNYYIFQDSFYHIIAKKNLYLSYPGFDLFLYGPIFTLLVAPFAIFPSAIGSILWVLFNTAFLFFAIMKLPIQKKWKTAILILSSHEMMNHSAWFQSNAFVAACIILGFVYVNKEKEIWALFFILLATFVKIYGIVGLSFFFFSSNKIKFIGWSIIWSLVFFIAPLIFTSWDFLSHSYIDWYHLLQVKHKRNIDLTINNDFQDISVMGMIKRIFNYPTFNSLFVLIPAALMVLSQFLRISDFSDLRYRIYICCSVMISTVIFSSGAESPTYIIAFTAVCIWYVIQNKSKLINAVFIFALIFTSFSYSDLLTPAFREQIVRPYSLKAFPCLVIWIILFFQILKKQYRSLSFEKLALHNQ
jgi:Glycosyltransferase family 87